MINRVVLVGRITRDVDMRVTSSNIPVVSFSLAVNRKYTNELGERPADFINCVAWRHSAQFMKDYVRKGNLLAVEGQIQTRNYEDQSGTTRYITEVVCDSVQLLERTEQNFSQERKAPETSHEQDEYEAISKKITENSEDDLPF